VSDEAPEQVSQKPKTLLKKSSEDAHEKGDVAKSQEVNTWFILLGLDAGVRHAGATDQRQPRSNRSRYCIGQCRPVRSWAVQALDGVLEQSHLARALLGTRYAALVDFVVLAACGIAANLVQHRPLLSARPDHAEILQDFNPIAGAKRLFSTEALVNFGKGI
jgi:flagellar biosynthetic protein FlhB